MKDKYIENLEVIASLYKRLLDTEDKLAEKTQSSDYWYNQYRELKLKYEPNTEDF